MQRFAGPARFHPPGTFVYADATNFDSNDARIVFFFGPTIAAKRKQALLKLEGGN